MHIELRMKYNISTMKLVIKSNTIILRKSVYWQIGPIEYNYKIAHWYKFAWDKYSKILKSTDSLILNNILKKII